MKKVVDLLLRIHSVWLKIVSISEIGVNEKGPKAKEVEGVAQAVEPRERPNAAEEPTFGVRKRRHFCPDRRDKN